uniref:BTB domain-containing protein n=1 Tax=Sus scrofa TaxID=9823 RepID=A0A8W4FFN2_PIG
MGLLNSRILRCRESDTAEPQQLEAQAGPSYVFGSRKRKEKSGPCLGPESENNYGFLDQEDDLQKVVSTSQGKKVKIASEYAYQTLFLNGENSDIKIRALGKEWNLHKVYLCQSGYFASMFSGAWRETTMNTIELQMPDENIDREALHEALGSLYRNPVLIPPSRVVPILATASMLQLDELIQQYCLPEHMMRTRI